MKFGKYATISRSKTAWNKIKTFALNVSQDITQHIMNALNVKLKAV